jgi:tetratricopeptide (TPR) repeat protein
MSGASAASFPEGQPPQQTATITIEGTVRDSAGALVSGAALLLEEKGKSAVIETRTNATGTYRLTATHAGTYTVRAKKSGCLDTVVDAIALSLGDKKHIDLVLYPQSSLKVEPSAAKSSAKAATDTMEFKDEPNFTVAGVTDWSNLGLHGSAATSRTSEALAKQTLGLESNEPDSGAPSAQGSQYAPALVCMAAGDFARAREEIQKELAIADNAQGHRLLGEVDERLSDPLDAVREYQLAVRMEPNEENYFEWGTELLLHKAAEPAVEVFTRGSSAHPKSARMLTGLGAALYASGSWEEAARRLCAASELQPGDPAPYLFLGKIEKATPVLLPCSGEKLARFAREQPGNALANYYYAVSLWKREKESGNAADSKKVEALLDKAVAIDPKLDEAYLQLGVLHSSRGEFERAMRDYQKAIELNPNLGEAHRQLGLAYQRKGEPTKAQQEFKEYERDEKADAAELERQQRELGQFLIILKDQPGTTSPQQ